MRYERWRKHFRFQRTIYHTAGVCKEKKLQDIASREVYCSCFTMDLGNIKTMLEWIFIDQFDYFGNVWKCHLCVTKKTVSKPYVSFICLKSINKFINIFCFIQACRSLKLIWLHFKYWSKADVCMCMYLWVIGWRGISLYAISPYAQLNWGCDFNQIVGNNPMFM